MDQPITRREMLCKAAVLVGGTCLCQRSAMGAERFTNCITPDLEPDSYVVGPNSITVDLAKAATISEVGSAANLSTKEPRIDIVVVHAAKEKYYALSRFCTHAGRTLSYIRTRRVLMCTNSNHSTFDLDGSIIKGPAETALTPYAVHLENGTLRIAL